MRTSRVGILTGLALTLPLAVTAAETGEKVEKKKDDVVIRSEKTTRTETQREVVVTKQEPVKEERRDGNKFVNFWVHTVGGTIGNGLKKGADKIGDAFD